MARKVAKDKKTPKSGKLGLGSSKSSRSSSSKDEKTGGKKASSSTGVSKSEVLAKAVLKCPIKGRTLEGFNDIIGDRCGGVGGANTGSYLNFAVRIEVLKRDGDKYKPA